MSRSGAGDTWGWAVRVLSTSLLAICIVICGAAFADEYDDLASEAHNLMQLLSEAADQADEATSIFEDFAELEARVDRANNDPAALSGEEYAAIYRDITNLILRLGALGAPVPPGTSETVNLASAIIAEIIEGAVDFSLDLARTNFERQLSVVTGDDRYPFPQSLWEAADRTTNSWQVKLWVVMDWIERNKTAVPHSAPYYCVPPDEECDIYVELTTHDFGDVIFYWYADPEFEHIATYGNENGRIVGGYWVRGAFGDIEGLKGYWIEDASARECDGPPVDGSVFWGVVELRFDQEFFTANWNYCGLPAEDGLEWRGELQAR